MIILGWRFWESKIHYVIIYVKYFNEHLLMEKLKSQPVRVGVIVKRIDESCGVRSRAETGHAS